MSTGQMGIPAGNGQHPIMMVVISSKDLTASTRFYTTVFGWQLHALSEELASGTTSGGPVVSIRAGVPEGFPAMVPFLAVPDVKQALDGVVAAGGSVERVPWTVPMAGTLARFKDPSGTIYGLIGTPVATAVPPIPMPFGDNPRPPAGSVCSIEMYAADGAAAGAFFGDLFGWGTAPTMPQFLGFDPGAGICGVMQSHTPANPAMTYIFVDDVKAALGAIESAGGKKLGDPMSMPGMGTFGYFLDVSGTPMGLIGR
jgi:predicted enzyme related to lactoylglutathione lyase